MVEEEMCRGDLLFLQEKNTPERAYHGACCSTYTGREIN